MLENVFFMYCSIVSGFITGVIIMSWALTTKKKKIGVNPRKKKQRHWYEIKDSFLPELMIKQKTKRKKKQKKETKPKLKSEKVTKENEEQSPVEKDHSIVLSERIHDKSDSWVELNCAADDIDLQEYVDQKRAGEDASYEIAKRRIEESKFQEL